MAQAQNTDLQQPFWVADWHVDPGACRLKRAGKEVKLEPKAMTVLVCLARNAGEVMTRDQLEAVAWQGMVVGYDSLAGSIIKLRRAFGDDSKNPQFIETVPKRGYRLIAEVKPDQDDRKETVTGSQATLNQPEKVRPRPKRYYLPVFIIFLITILVAIGTLYFSEQALDSEERSIAVLPFQNLSNDPDQDYFSDGITADLITDLSKISSLAVIARNSVFTYKNIDVDVRQLREELGVKYVVEGSVRKAEGMVRISVSLIDTKNGRNIWAERFDGELKNIFALQDDVTKKVVSSLAIKLTENEQEILAREYTNSIEAYDEFLQGWQLFWILSKETNRSAREHFLNAIKLDSQFARAYANLALTYAYDNTNGWHDDPEYSMEKARFYARKGVELDPALPQVYWVLGLTHIFSKEYQAALEAAQKNLELDPNNADGYGLLATILNYAGQPKQALDMMQKAIRLNPRHPHIYLIIRGEINFNLHDYKNAIHDFELALSRNPEAQEARLWLAAAYAHTGQIDDASWQLEHIRHDGISFTLNYVENVVPFNDPVQRMHLLDGLRIAGLEGR